MSAHSFAFQMFCFSSLLQYAPVIESLQFDIFQSDDVAVLQQAIIVTSFLGVFFEPYSLNEIIRPQLNTYSFPRLLLGHSLCDPGKRFSHFEFLQSFEIFLALTKRRKRSLHHLLNHTIIR